MTTSQDAVEHLAGRIERAYRRRHPGWKPIGLGRKVWESAASRLLQASDEDAKIPIDPELFVAAQVLGDFAPNPWADLTQKASLDRYRRALRRIVLQLRDELKAEVRRAKCRMHRGISLDQILATECEAISPLTRYILAHRAGRHDLSVMHRAAAENQDRSCPLYRMASRSLLPVDAYPSAELAFESPIVGVGRLVPFSLN